MFTEAIEDTVGVHTATEITVAAVLIATEITIEIKLTVIEVATDAVPMPE